MSGKLPNGFREHSFLSKPEAAELNASRLLVTICQVGALQALHCRVSGGARAPTAAPCSSRLFSLRPTGLPTPVGDCHARAQAGRLVCMHARHAHRESPPPPTQDAEEGCAAGDAAAEVQDGGVRLQPGRSLEQLRVALSGAFEKHKVWCGGLGGALHVGGSCCAPLLRVDGQEEDLPVSIEWSSMSLLAHSPSPPTPIQLLHFTGGMGRALILSPEEVERFGSRLNSFTSIHCCVKAPVGHIW